jgi:hypothetical protein
MYSKSRTNASFKNYSLQDEIIIRDRNSDLSDRARISSIFAIIVIFLKCAGLKIMATLSI